MSTKLQLRKVSISQKSSSGRKQVNEISVKHNAVCTVHCYTVLTNKSK